MIPLALTNTACAAVARTLQLRGPSSSTCTACAAGADAIGTALWLIRSGRADAMFAGGADSAISPVVLAGYRNLGALATLRHGAEGASRPFDSERDGFVIGEGSGVLVLEEREHALARGARIYAELAGYGSSCDASHLTDPDETGAGPGTGDVRRARGRGPRPGGHRLRQRARHLDALGRRRRGARDRRAPAWRTPRSRPPSRCTATRSAAPAASRRPPRCCRSCAASCRRRSTSSSPTTAAVSITSWAPRAAASTCARRSRTASASAATTPRSCSSGRDERRSRAHDRAVDESRLARERVIRVAPAGGVRPSVVMRDHDLVAHPGDVLARTAVQVGADDG